VALAKRLSPPRRAARPGLSFARCILQAALTTYHQQTSDTAPTFSIRSLSQQHRKIRPESIFHLNNACDIV
jgi:hypothetical protein